jgi:hypothetical protein
MANRLEPRPDQTDYQTVMGLVLDAWQQRKVVDVTLAGRALGWAGVAASTDGRSIFGAFGTYRGECVLTRARDGFLAVVSRKLYKFPSSRRMQDTLLLLIEQRGIPHFVVHPPHPALLVSPDLLEKWWAGAQRWANLNPEQVQAKYRRFAERCIDAVTGGEQFLHRDGFVEVEAWGRFVYSWCEAVLVHPPDPDAPFLLSGVRHHPSTQRYLLREALRAVMDINRVRYAVVSPNVRPGGLTSPEHLVATWRSARLQQIP